MASPGSADNPRKRGRTTRASGTGARPLVHLPLFAPGIAVSAAPLFPVQAAAAAPQPAPRPRTPEASNQAQPRWLARNANAARAQTVLGPDGGVSGCVGDLCDRLLASLASSASESSVDDKVRLKCAEVRQADVAGRACLACPAPERYALLLHCRSKSTTRTCCSRRPRTRCTKSLACCAPWPAT